MIRWLALLAIAVIIVVLGIIVEQVPIEIAGIVLGIAAIALLVWSLQSSRATHPAKKPVQSVKSKRPFRRGSVTAALHAAIFSSSSSDTDE